MAGFALTGAIVLSACCLGAAFSGWLAAYLVTSTAYSLRLKKAIVIDVLVLAGLYTLRIAAGAAAVSVPLSPWLLAFAMFFFLSLALAKRYIELRGFSGTTDDQLPGRGYRSDDAALLEQIGPTSGYLAVAVFCLYIESSAVARLYRRPEFLWLACPLLLYWLTRFWLLARETDSIRSGGLRLERSREPSRHRLHRGGRSPRCKLTRRRRATTRDDVLKTALAEPCQAALASGCRPQCVWDLDRSRHHPCAAGPASLVRKLHDR